MIKEALWMDGMGWLSLVIRLLSIFIANNRNSDENAEDDVDCSLPPDCFSQPSPTCLIRKFDMSCSLTNNSASPSNSFTRINTNTVIQILKHMQINSQKFMSTQIS